VTQAGLVSLGPWAGVQTVAWGSANLVRLSDMDPKKLRQKSIRNPDRTTQLGIRW